MIADLGCPALLEMPLEANRRPEVRASFTKSVRACPSVVATVVPN
ncbi:hypothetical protein [Streptomyces sp. NL15-2K]|nr:MULTISPECIES: hypothetical protein [Actinomycetes]WKX12476.1 hypothetical protein Q4V64_35095 [Kutzneria buriramensis]GCB46015.1 hypothetical protein SNL152K_3311 [Streptomyces sp. NL15-2K]